MPKFDVLFPLYIRVEAGSKAEALNAAWQRLSAMSDIEIRDEISDYDDEDVYPVDEEGNS